MELSTNFKYLVINTGYTHRLINNIEELENKIKQQLNYLCSNDKNCDHCKDYILYIFEQIPGRKFSYKNDIVAGKQERKTIKNKINTKHRKGVIVTRCNHISQAFVIINILIEQKYCSKFTLQQILSIETMENILIFNFNCES